MQMTIEDLEREIEAYGGYHKIDEDQSVETWAISFPGSLCRCFEIWTLPIGSQEAPSYQCHHATETT
jgi:hypothetical protein